MGWLSRILNCIPTKKPKGISFGKEPLWEISCCKNLPSFLRALYNLCPSGSILYIEGGTPRNDIHLYLETRKPTQVALIDTGTMWPRPKCFHMTISLDNLEGLAKLAERHNELEVAFHLHVYQGEHLLLQWYDAFLEPFYISREIPEEKIKQFCNYLNLKYSNWPSNSS